MKKVYYGGPIITMEGENQSCEAVLVEKGIIAKTGTLEEVLACAGDKTKLCDLKGKALLPGFIDPHSHIVMNGQMALFADLGDCSCFADVIEKMTKYIKANRISPEGVAVGFGYDHNFLDEQAHPNKFVLDKVSNDIPVIVMHVSGHLACCNSAMLELAGITAQTEDPKGGKYGRVEGTNEPDGYLEETATMEMQAIMGGRIKPKISKLLKGMSKSYVENGITTAQDGATSKQNLSLLKLARKLGMLKIDVVCYPLVTDDPQALCRKNPFRIGKYRNRIKIGGYKMILDGSPQGRSAWMSKPYLNGEEGYCGYPWLSDEDVLKYCNLAIKNKKQLLTHCNGDAASEQLLNAYEKALEGKKERDLRPVMIHCQTVRTDQLERMAKINMIPSIFVGHVYYWGNVHIKNFGPERGNRISPAAEAQSLGLKVNFHQDTPITKPNMLHTVWCAVTRTARDGSVIGEDQKISVYSALEAITINGAYQYFEEDSKGSIKEGKRADLVILNRNPLEVDPESIKDIQVLETIKDGKTIFKKGIR